MFFRQWRKSLSNHVENKRIIEKTKEMIRNDKIFSNKRGIYLALSNLFFRIKSKSNLDGRVSEEEIGCEKN